MCHPRPGRVRSFSFFFGPVRAILCGVRSPPTSPLDRRSADADGLIPLVSQPPERPWAGFAALVFVLCTGGVGLLDLLRPAPVPTLVGQERADQERVRARSRIRDGSRMEVWSSDLDRRSNVAHFGGPFYTAALLRWLGETNEEVVLGRDGWLFLTVDVAPPIASRDVARLTARRFAMIDRQLARRGVELWVLPVPRKAVICREYLPADVDPRIELDRRVLRQLRRAGVSTVDLFEAFAGHGAEELWYREDTHWTPRAQELCAAFVAAESGRLVPEAGRVTRLVPAPGPVAARQDLLSYMGVIPRSAAARWLLPPDPGSKLELRALDGSERAPSQRARDAELALVGTSLSKDVLADCLRHFTGGEVDTFVRPGGNHLMSLGSFLRKRRDRPPEMVVVECPIPQYARSSVSSEPLEHYLSSVPLRHASVLATLPAERGRDERGARTLGSLPGGALVTRGDGAVAVRVRGEAKHPTRVRLRVGDRVLSLPWSDDVGVLDVPVVHGGEGGEGLVVSLAGAGAPDFELAGIELVTDYDLGSGVAAISEGRRRDGPAWTETMRFASPTPLPRHAALLLRCAPGPAATRLRITLGSPDGEPLVLEPVGVGGGALVLLSLPRHAAGPWNRVELGGEGEAPTFTEAMLLSLARD